MHVDPGPSGAPAPGPEPEASDDSVAGAAPGLARIAMSAWWNAAEWTVGTSLRVGSRLMRSAVSDEAAAEFLQTAGADIREYLRKALGALNGGQAPRAEEETEESTVEATAESEAPAAALQERGAELLRRSADVRYEESYHPAYERILELLAPDEARILRLLATRGPQPAVDVRSGLPLASELVALGQSMIGAEAGCRHLDRVHAYLNNLYRLGLIWFSREQVKDPRRYQVLEAQPEVTEAMQEAGRFGRTVRRSIHLTPFGIDFCETCIPLDTAEFEALATEQEEREAEPPLYDPGMP